MSSISLLRRIPSHRGPTEATLVDLLARAKRSLSNPSTIILAILWAVILVVVLQVAFDAINSSSYDAAASNIINDILVYDLPSGTVQTPPFLSPVNPKGLVPKGYVSIDAAHRNGRIHTGAWIYIVDDADKLLLLRRGPKLVTCPLRWGMVGEHTFRDERSEDTLRRGIVEELGTDMWNEIEQRGKYYNMTEHPVFYFRDYGPEGENRIDRQVTYLWLVDLGVSSDEAERILKVDEEVQEYQFMNIDEVEQWVKSDMEESLKSMESDNMKSFCHESVGSLILFGFERIRAIRKNQDRR